MKKLFNLGLFCIFLVVALTANFQNCSLYQSQQREELDEKGLLVVPQEKTCLPYIADAAIQGIFQSYDVTFYKGDLDLALDMTFRCISYINGSSRSVDSAETSVSRQWSDWVLESLPPIWNNVPTEVDETSPYYLPLNVEGATGKIFYVVESSAKVSFFYMGALSDGSKEGVQCKMQFANSEFFDDVEPKAEIINLAIYRCHEFTKAALCVIRPCN